MKQFTMTTNVPQSKGMAHCPICTHTVEATIVMVKRALRVKPGQRCSRCGSSLDAAYVVRYDKAA
ncbi:MAG: hypothetical protein KIT09_17165 [Bryobacteraceae bacterium]|nr:hypothetical protein [Bryobacteraceae bacterium]